MRIACAWICRTFIRFPPAAVLLWRVGRLKMNFLNEILSIFTIPVIASAFDNFCALSTSINYIDICLKIGSSTFPRCSRRKLYFDFRIDFPNSLYVALNHFIVGPRISMCVAQFVSKFFCHFYNKTTISTKLN